MARAPKETDFNVTIEGVGTFTFARRNSFRIECEIQVEYARIIDGVEPTSWLQIVGGWLSTLKVLTVRAPDGWDLETLDPLDDNDYAKLNAVFGGLTEKERSFRVKPGAAGQGNGASAA